MKRNRYSLKYRFWHWFYGLRKQDFVNVKNLIVLAISEFLAIIGLLVLMFILPFFFH